MSSVCGRNRPAVVIAHDVVGVSVAVASHALNIAAAHASQLLLVPSSQMINLQNLESQIHSTTASSHTDMENEILDRVAVHFIKRNTNSKPEQKAKREIELRIKP